MLKGLTENILAPMLTYLSSLTGSLGLGIILLTCIVKLILLPLTLHQEKSMARMRDIQPEIDKIKEKYKDDPKTFQTKTSEIYKKYKVNPFSGCLPMIIQMPIFIALFTVFRSHTPVADGIQQQFLWIKSFNLPDKFMNIAGFDLNLLPILSTIVTFIQQKMMSKMSPQNEGNKSMQSMMYTMPIMMLFLFYTMPSGVTLYYVVSGLLTLIQQYFILKGRKKNEKNSESKK